jgi:hypothetical protein
VHVEFEARQERATHPGGVEGAGRYGRLPVDCLSDVRGHSARRRLVLRKERARLHSRPVPEPARGKVYTYGAYMKLHPLLG